MSSRAEFLEQIDPRQPTAQLLVGVRRDGNVGFSLGFKGADGEEVFDRSAVAHEVAMALMSALNKAPQTIIDLGRTGALYRQVTGQDDDEQS